MPPEQTLTSVAEPGPSESGETALPQPSETKPATLVSAPIDAISRHLSLDAVRGFALLGILLMNIAAWGLHFAAYDNPTVTGGPATGANLWFWVVNHLLFEGKMRALFSMVFGAGIIVLTSRLEARGVNSADVYYRRLLWLMLFGIADAYLLWLGDILYPYSLCGLALYPFRNMKPKGLIITGTLIILLNAGAYVGQRYHFTEIRDLSQKAEQATKDGKPLTDEQIDAKREWEAWSTEMMPSAKTIAKDAKAYRGGYLDGLKRRTGLVASFIHASLYYGPSNWDIWGMMLLGMALYKLGVFSGERSTGFYVKLALICYAVGLAANTYTATQLIRIQWDPVTRGVYSAPYDLGRFTIGIAHASLIILLCKQGWLNWATRPLAAVGQMAFSNYVLQSIVCNFIFYGIGLGLYGKLERYQLLYVVAGTWVLNLAFSLIWMRYFRFGPLEWCWRSLTYWKRQPMKLAPGEQAMSAA